MSEEHGKFATAAIHAGQEPEKWTSWAVCPPISLATTFKQPDPGVTKAGFEYSRGGNPTRNSLEEAFAAICHGKKGKQSGNGEEAGKEKGRWRWKMEGRGPKSTERGRGGQEKGNSHANSPSFQAHAAKAYH